MPEQAVNPFGQIVKDAYSQAGVDYTPTDNDIKSIQDQYKGDHRTFLKDFYREAGVDYQLTDDDFKSIDEHYGLTQSVQPTQPESEQPLTYMQKELRKKFPENYSDEQKPDPIASLHSSIPYVYVDENNQNNNQVVQSLPESQQDVSFNENNLPEIGQEGFIDNVIPQQKSQQEQYFNQAQQNTGGARINSNQPEESLFFSSPEEEKIDLAQNIIDRSKRQINAVTGQGDNTGAGDALRDRNFWTLGASDLSSMIYLKKIAGKLEDGTPLTEGDKALLEAWNQSEQVNQQYPSSDANIWYKTGKNVTDMIPWLVQFAATRGTGSTVIKGIQSTLKQNAEKYLGKTIASGLSKGIAEVAGAYAAAAFMPNTYADITRRTLGQSYQDEQGNIKFDVSEADSNAKAIYKGWTNSMLEVLTERLGEGITEGIKYLPKNKFTSLLTSEAKGKTGKAISDFTKAVGWNGAPIEYLEEWVNVPLNALLVGDNKYSDMFDGKQQLETLLTVAAMGTAIGSTQYAANKYDSYRSARNYKSAKSLFDNEIDDETRNMVESIINSNQSISEISDKLDQIFTNLNGEEAGIIMNYVVNSMKNTGSQQPTGPVSSDSAPQFTISPRQQAEFDLRSTASQFANNETGLLQTIQEVTPDGQENRIWFIKAGQTTDPDGSILVEDEAGNSKFLTKEQIAGEPNNMTIDDFVNMKLSEYDQTKQNQELLKQKQIKIYGKQYILTGDQTNKGLVALTDDGSETVVPFNIIDKIKGSGTSNANIVQRAYGKTNITGIKNDDGSITLTDNYDLDKANSLKEEIEKSTGGKATVQAELIPNEDSTLPDSYQLSIVPVQSNIDTSTENTQEINQNVTTSPSQDNNVSAEQPKAIYKLNGQDIDQTTAKARVRAAILKGSADKLAGLEISNDPELSGMIEKAFPKPKAKFTLGKKTISPEDAMDWIIAADNFNELNELKAENIDSEPAIAEAFRAKVKYFTPTQREVENSENIENTNRENISENQNQIPEQQNVENIQTKESSQNNQLSKKERTKIIANKLLDDENDIDGAFSAAGYTNIDGFWVEPGAEVQFGRLSQETKDILKSHGVVFVNNSTAAGVRGDASSLVVGDKVIIGISISDVGEFNTGYDHAAIHELGHALFLNLPQETRDLFYLGNPITEHGNNVKNQGTEIHKQVYGNGEFWGDEDFADLFADNKGDLEKTIQDKKNQLQNEESENVNREVAGTTPQTENTPQEEQGQGVNEGLEENVIKNRVPASEDGEFRIIGDGNNNLYRINEFTGRPQVFLDGYWQNDALPPRLFLYNASKSGFVKKSPTSDQPSVETVTKPEIPVSANVSAVPPVATISQTPEDSFDQLPDVGNMVEQAASEVNTNPTEAQREAGNYKKGHVTIQGMDITIENPKGSFRSGKDEDGKAWETEMKSHYGYFKRTNGKDGDHIDTFIGENPESQTVFVVDQNNPKTGEFDESKVMLGYNTPEEAKSAYLSNYEPDWKGFGSITPVPIDEFKTWLYDGAKQRKPFADYKSTPKPVIIPDVSLESDQVQDVAGQDSGQRPAVKEPWQMTRDEYIDSLAMQMVKDLNDGKDNVVKNNFVGEGKPYHREVVKQALSEGKPVPEEVLNDYPELKPVVQENLNTEKPKSLEQVLKEGKKEVLEKKQSTQLPKEPKKPLMDVLKEGKEVVEGKKLTPELTLYNVPESFNEKSFIEFNRALAKGEVNVDQFKRAFEVLLSSKDAIISELNGMTKAELLKGMSGMGQYRYKNEKKDATVKAIWSDHLMDFAFGSISYTFDGTPMEQIVAKKVANTTQKNIDDYVAETQKRKQEYINRVQEFKKALTNPETLPEFRIFIDKNGLDKLSPEQKAAYDNLVTDKTIEKRNAVIENKSVVSKVDLAGVEMDITETKHTKTGVPLFVVKLSERVSKEDYQDLNSKAKQLGGYYSSFRGQGAVPGFQFKTREQAQKFVDLKKQDASNLDLIEEKQDTKLADRVSKLRENAQKIIDRVDSELSKDRLTNTAKRASQAASTEARLGKEKQIAQTMMNIANAIENGDVKLLDGVKAKTHIELLDGLINQAKYKEISADSPTYTERMAREGEPATVKTVEFAQDSFYPNIYADHIKSLIDKVGDRSGVKLIASRWSKKLLSTKSQDYYKVKSQSEVDELTDMVNALRGNEKSYNRVAEEIADYNRLKSMGIENDSMLRAALREYVQYRGKSQEVDKVKKLERALVGRKNIGIDFFPTPKETAQLMVDEAGITEGMDVLEPSAGNGNIADAIKETGVQPDVIELSSALSEVLEAKGYDVVASDFMDFDGKKYDRIVMNPPFSNGMDGDHVQHAYELLKPGGRIVAIVGEGTFIRNDKKAVAFREWLDEVGGTEEKLNQGTFQDRTLLNTTGANARLVIIDKSQSDANFRIIGETGAANLDKAEEATTRLDNLAIAREMEQAGKDVKSIRLATGWEKGVDQLWRYEVPDGKFNKVVQKMIDNQKANNIPETWGLSYPLSLNKIIDDPQMFIEYPELANVKVQVNVKSGNKNKGSYSSNLLDTELGKIDVQASDFENFKSVLIHEIQHAIQDIEGFARGGSEQSIRPEMLQYPMMSKKAQEKIDDYYKNDPDGIAIDQYIDKWLEEHPNATDAEFDENDKYIRETWPSVNKLDQYQQILTQQRNAPKTRAEAYKRLAGEVESRNVQSRMNMTPEERLNTLLSETEDVAREDQIVLMDGLGVSNLEGEFEYTNHQNLIDKLESGAIETDEVILDDNEGLALQLAGKISEKDLNEIRNSGRDLGGFELFGKVYINSAISPIEVVKTWIHEKTHRQLKRIFPQKARREQFLNRVFDHVGEREINATLPKIYHGDSKEQQAEEYIAFKVQEYGMTGNVNADPEIKNIIFELLNRFTTLKNIQDATHGINLAQQRSGKRNAYDGLRGRSGLQENGRIGGKGEPNFNRGLRQNEGREGAETSRIKELSKQAKNNPSVFSEYLSEAKKVVSKNKKNLPDGIMTEKEFNKKYFGQHKDIRSGSKEKAIETFKEIQQNGFNSGAYIIPIYKGGNPTSITESKYGPRKGDLIYLVPKEWIKTHRINPDTIKEGWKPTDDEFVEIEYDNQSSYEAYVNNLKKQSQPENTILIDGKLRSTVNSKGLPIAQTEEGIRNFWKWFGDSKVVDEQGRPLVVYHSTKKDFDVFKLKGLSKGFFFADHSGVDMHPRLFDKDRPYQTGASIITAYLSIQNPKIIQNAVSDPWIENDWINQAKKEKYDGLNIMPDVINTFVAFSPSQIKSATGNNGSFDPNNNDIRYRRGEVPLNDYLEEAARQNQEAKKTRRNLSEVAEGVREFIQDHDLPIRRLEEKVKQLGGKIADNMKPYRDMSLSYGRIETLYKKFTKDKFEPIIKTISKIVKSGTPAGEVLPYVICKHALERNPYMRAIELKEWQDNAEIELKKWIDANIDIPQATKDRKVKEFTDALEAKKQELSKKDYSGVRGFDPSNNFETPDELAQEIVDEFERKTPIGLVDELWSNVKNATSEIVDIWGKGQTMSEEQVQQTKDRFKYFVPLRGWRHGVAKQLVYKKGEGFSGSLQRIKGRTSIAENPLAYIEQIAFKALGEQVDNEVKTSLLNLVVGNYSDDFQQFYRLKKAYYIKDGIDENGEQMWKLTTERPSEELFKSGDAVTKIYNQYQKLRTPSQAHEHEVYVKRPNGDLVVVMVGDMLPVAQAMNKKNTMYRNLFTGKPNDAEFWNKPLSATIGAWNNTLKGMYTAYNIVFPITNFMRDAQEASITQFIKGDNGHLVVKNYKNAFPAIIRSLRGKESGGKYDEMLKEFRETGGNTGYTHLKTPEQLEKEINSELEMLNRTGTFRGYTIDKARKALSAIEAWNQIFEDATRFSVYITSREAGKSAKEAANDSKEASVNFNRKGKSSKAFDSVWAFWNVAIQSMQKNFKLAKDHKGKFGMVAGAWLALGFIEAMMNDAMGGDDDKDYYNISDYVRENYLIIPVLFGDKKDKYLRIPLPQFWRGFKSAGSIAYDVMNGKMDILSATAKGLGNFLGGLLPIDIGGFYQNGEFSMAPVIPTVIRPVYEVKANRDYMGYTIAKEPFTKEQERSLAASGLGKDNVSPAIKFFTDYLFRAGGGDNETRFYTQNGDIKKVPGIFDYNPSYIEHLITGYTGGTGKFVTDVLTTAIDGLDTEKEVDFRNAPFINQFIKKIPEAKWKVIGEYYDIKSEGNESAFGQLKRSYFSKEDKTKYKEVAGSNYLNEYNAVVNAYDKRLTTMMQYMDYKTAEGSEEVINTMKDAIEAIKQVKQKYNKK